MTPLHFYILAIAVCFPWLRPAIGFLVLFTIVFDLMSQML